MNSEISSKIKVISEALIEYQTALELQRAIHQSVVADESKNTLLLLEHPSVYTAGKRTQDFEKPTDGTPVIAVDRGGRITWHGPGQLVGYPIVKLLKPTELVGFVRTLEGALIQVCEYFDIKSTRVEGRSGVWVVENSGARKIAAIGIRVASGVTMHGFALNISPDLKSYSTIIPCGIEDAAVTSMELELGRTITRAEVEPIIIKCLLAALDKVSL